MQNALKCLSTQAMALRAPGPPCPFSLRAEEATPSPLHQTLSFERQRRAQQHGRTQAN